MRCRARKYAGWRVQDGSDGSENDEEENCGIGFFNL